MAIRFPIMPASSLFVPPAGYERIRVVGNFKELVETALDGGVNALCWPRTLPGDFGEVVAALDAGRGITPVDEARLRTLKLSAAGGAARDVLLEDQQRLLDLGLLPSLDCVNGYLNEPEPGPVRTDVQSFHVDSATVEADTWLCTYHGPASQGLRNDEAVRRVDLPETRAALLALSGGADDAEFGEFLNDHYYDLHYAPVPLARPWDFGLGHLWRIATAYPGSPVPPCIHRAPPTLPDQPARLLLIS
jgi:hypothetical protein